MEYIIASLVAILVATLIVYKVANNILELNLRLRPLLLCAICAMFISLVLPKIVVGFAGLPGTLAVLAIFAVIFAYFVAKYESKTLPWQENNTEAETVSCPTETPVHAITSEEKKNAESVIADDQLTAIENKLKVDISTLAVKESVEAQAESSAANDDSNDLLVEHKDHSIDQQQINSQVNMDDKIKEEVVQEIVATENGEAVSNEEAEAIENIIVDDQLTQPERALNNLAVLLGSELDLVEPGLIIATKESLDVLEEKNAHTTDHQSTVTDQEVAEIINTNKFVDAEAEQPSSLLLIESNSAEEAGNDHPADNQLTQSGDDDYLETSLSVGQAKEADFRESETSNVLINEGLGLLDQQPIDSQHGIILAAESDAYSQSTKSEYDIDANTLSYKREEEPRQRKLEVSEQNPNEKANEEVVTQEEFSLTPESSLFQEEDDSSMKDHDSTESVQFEAEQLDDLIDFAFTSKENQDYHMAFNVFSKALTLYPNSKAAPFLIVEIGNILKNKGDYDGAIKVFSNGRNFSQTKQDEMIEQEFISTIAYLRIIKNILLQNNLGNIPFLEIPPQIIKQIDEEFKEWRNVSNI